MHKDQADKDVADSPPKEVDVVAASTLSTSSRWATLPRHHRSETSPTKDVVAWLPHSKAKVVP